MIRLVNPGCCARRVGLSGIDALTSAQARAHRVLLVFWLLIPGSAATACSPESTAYLVLVPDTSINTQTEVVRDLSSVQVVLDAESGGFRGKIPDTAADGAFYGADVDEDGFDELVIDLEVGDGGVLPLLRIDPGHNENGTASIQVRGLATTGALIAYGGIKEQKLFAKNGPKRIVVPFNLVRWLRRARVVAVTPSVLPAARPLGAIGVYASRSLDRASLEDGARVSIVHGNDEELLPGVLHGPFPCPFGTEMWYIELTGCHHRAGGDPRLRVSFASSIVDTHGDPLQEPVGAGAVSLMSEDADQLSVGTGCTANATCLSPPGPSATGLLVLTCDEASGLAYPVPCAVGSGASCIDENDVFDSVPARSDVECEPYVRAEFPVEYADGSCARTGPWPCQHSSQCQLIGMEQCIPETNACQAIACANARCAEGLACVAGRGCVPALHGCVEDCRRHGGCPRRGERCVLNGTQAGKCR